MFFFYYLVLKKYVDKVMVQENGYTVFTFKYLNLNVDNFFLLLKKSYLFTIVGLVDLVGVNTINNKEYKYKLYYNLISYYYNLRIFMQLKIKKEYDNIKSVSLYYKSATWLEREVWDLLGIFFYNHEDLRRILTDYGFKGFPLNKDFPLTGFYEVRYDDSKKLIVYELVKLTQEYRNFYFLSPWN